MSAKPVYLSAFKAATRLQVLRGIAAKSGKTWQAARTYGFHNWESAHGTLAQGFDGENERNRVPVWYTFESDYFRNEMHCDNVADVSIKHTGWFCDVDCYETSRGLVARLSHDRFIAGYVTSVGGMRTWHGDIYTSERDAAYAADSLAERVAESEREHNERWHAARNLEDKNETNLQRLRECFVMRNNACLSYVRDEMRELIESIRTNRETLTRDYAAYL